MKQYSDIFYKIQNSVIPLNLIKNVLLSYSGNFTTEQIQLITEKQHFFVQTNKMSLNTTGIK
jgi:hypothetical protein